MKGLWHLNAAAIAPTVGLMIFDSIVALLLSIFTGTAILRRSKYWPEAHILHVGMLLLSIYSFLHLIDLIARIFGTNLPYSYILVGCFFNIFRVFSDVLILYGAWEVSIRYENNSSTKPEELTYDSNTRIGVGLGALLYFLGLYHVCLLFALSFAWLSFVDLKVINAIAQGRSAVEITFTIIQFLCTIGLTCRVYYNVNSYGPKSHPYIKFLSWLAASSIPLLVRSFCEIVIVGQLDRWPASIQDIARARDVTYGFFSVIFVILISFALPGDVVEEDLIKMEQDAVDGVTALITRELESVTEKGTKTAPTIPTLLETLESSRQPHEYVSVQRAWKDEVERLKAFYANWEPINKWPEENDNSDAIRTVPDSPDILPVSDSPRIRPVPASPDISSTLTFRLASSWQRGMGYDD